MKIVYKNDYMRRSGIESEDHLDAIRVLCETLGLKKIYTTNFLKGRNRIPDAKDNIYDYEVELFRGNKFFPNKANNRDNNKKHSIAFVVPRIAKDYYNKIYIVFEDRVVCLQDDIDENCIKDGDI